jgi:hypothetical protein
MVEISIKLPENLAKWLKKIADDRGETIDEVIAWTLGTVYNLYDRWTVALERRQRKETLRLQLGERLKEKLAKYKEYLKSQGYVKIDDYYRVAEEFVEWLLNKKWLSESEGHVSMETFEKFLGEGKQNLSSSTKRTYRSWFRPFLKFLET